MSGPSAKANQQKKNKTICQIFHKMAAIFLDSAIELLNNNSHGLAPPGGLVSPSGGCVSILCDQGLHFASIKLCQAFWI